MIRVGTKIYPNTAKDKLAAAPAPEPAPKPKKVKANGKKLDS